MSIMAAHRPKIHDDVDVLIFPGRLLYWEPAGQEFVGNYKGIFTVSTYADGDKARIAFKPSITESASLHSETIVNFCELKEGFNAEIHHGLAMRLMEGTKKNAVTFGKCASMTHTNADGKALKTHWVARFKHEWEAANFLIVLNYLKDCKIKAKEAADKEVAAKQAAAKEAASLMETLKITTSDATSSGATGGETEEDSSLAGASQSSVDYLQSPTLSDYTDTEDECFVAESQASFFPPMRRK
jgi:hypothetical protein